MISLNISILYQIVLFVVLWLVLNKLLFQPYLRLLDERERRTTGAQHDCVELEHEGERLRARYQEKIAQGQAAGYAAKEAILQEARAEREKILAQARQQAAQNLEGVRSEIAAAMERERRLAASEAAALAEEMASKVLGRRVA